ncbi:MAG TPA: endonuclease/exonuclease/phosphatase family protein [Pyrinomonadaceae bacterium]
MKSLPVKLILCLALIAPSVLLNPSATATTFEPASAKVHLRVMTYNIHVGIGMDKKLNLERISEVIRNEKPDLVALQEVDRGVRRTNGIDEIVELARLTQMEYAFAPNLDYQGGKYGVAILSRFPIRSIDHRRYANKREAERRGLLRVEVSVKGRVIHFVTTHLDYQFADGRLFETEQLLQALADLKGPLIIAGDFNDEPNGTSYDLMQRSFTDGWRDAMKDEGRDGLTYPADKPAKRIDYVFVSKDIHVRGAAVRQTLASDHLPLVVDLELAPR